MKRVKPIAKNNPLVIRWLLLIVLLFLVGLGYALYKDYSVKADKQRFEKAQASIDKFYADIVSKVGQPAKVQRSQTCGYAARKFEKGPLSCGDYLYFVYGVNDKSQASVLVQDISTILAKSDMFDVTFSDSNSNLPFSLLSDAKRYQEVSTGFIESKSRLHCSSRSVYANKASIYHVLTVDTSNENLSTALVCQGNAKAEHYPPKGQ